MGKQPDTGVNVQNGKSALRRSRSATSGSARKKQAGAGYDAQLTKAAIAAAKLTPRCQQFVDIWLSGWEGDQLPNQRSLPTSRFKKLAALVMSAAVGSDPTRKVIYFGADLPRIMRA